MTKLLKKKVRSVFKVITFFSGASEWNFGNFLGSSGADFPYGTFGYLVYLKYLRTYIWYIIFRILYNNAMKNE